jgi:hypothetical protein
MLGGVAGVGIVFWQILAAPDNDPAITLAPIPAALYGFSFVAGLLLWLGRHGGRAASLAVLVLQVPKLMSPQIAFIFSVGCDFWVHYLWRDEFSLVGFELKLLSFHQIFTREPDAPFVFGVSLTALLFLAVLGRYKPATVTLLEPPAPPIDWDSSSRSAVPEAILSELIESEPGAVTSGSN